jgi:hypothetical protein
MTQQPKYCVTCAHTFRAARTPQYARCSKAEADENSDASLAGEMRKAGAACGPGATLWEPKNG